MDRRKRTATAVAAAKATSSKVAATAEPATRYSRSQPPTTPPAMAQGLRLRRGNGAPAAFLPSRPLSPVIEYQPLHLPVNGSVPVNRGCGRGVQQSTKNGKLPDFWKMRWQGILPQGEPRLP